MEQLEKILPNIFNDVTNLSQVCEEFIKSCLDEVSDLRFLSISMLSDKGIPSQTA